MTVNRLLCSLRLAAFLLMPLHLEYSSAEFPKAGILMVQTRLSFSPVPKHLAKAILGRSGSKSIVPAAVCSFTSTLVVHPATQCNTAAPFLVESGKNFRTPFQLPMGPSKLPIPSPLTMAHAFTGSSRPQRCDEHA